MQNKKMQVKLIKMKTLVMADDDDFNPTLAAMETEIKPKVLKTVNTLNKRIYKINKIPKRKTRLCFKFTKFFYRKRKRISKDC